MYDGAISVYSPKMPWLELRALSEKEERKNELRINSRKLAMRSRIRMEAGSPSLKIREAGNALSFIAYDSL